MKVQPLGNKIAVVKLKSETQTDSGIFIAKGVDSFDKAKVIAVGPDVKGVNVNETVLINWNKASMSTIDSIPVYIVVEDEVVGVFD